MALRADVPHTAAELKAVFLLNFGAYVEWPAALPPDAPFRIGVCGDAELAAALEKVVRGEKVGGHTVLVVRVREWTEAQSCQVLHVAAGRERDVNLANLETKPVLTCGETERFEIEGGIVRFVPERNRIKLRVNLSASKRAGLRMSSQLLRICETREAPP